MAELSLNDPSSFQEDSQDGKATNQLLLHSSVEFALVIECLQCTG